MAKAITARPERLDVRLYTKDGCHLCDDARPMIIQIARRYRSRVLEIDISSDDELLAKFGQKIPVLRIDEGNQVALRITRERVERAFARAAKRKFWSSRAAQITERI